jgi:hypothetical protein
MEKNTLMKAFIIIKRNKFLRVINILSIVMILGFITLAIINFSFKEKAAANINQIETNRQVARSLEAVLQNAGTVKAEESILTKKTFAEYDEVIPFVAMLEDLFSIIDPESEINIKGKEDEIYLNHYADYKVNLKVENGKKSLFFKALDELYNSKFITEVISFSVNYLPENEGDISQLNMADITIRLYLN